MEKNDKNIQITMIIKMMMKTRLSFTFCLFHLDIYIFKKTKGKNSKIKNKNNKKKRKDILFLRRNVEYEILIYKRLVITVI